jgi:MFS family permease
LAVASGATIAIAWSAIGQFVLPLRASREFDFDRIGVALLVALPQVVDVALLLPMGAVADRTSRTRVLGVVMAMLAIAVVSIALGQLWVVVVGAVLLGAGMAAWMLPVSLVNQGAAPESIAWRTARYRLAVDAGIFLGPVLGGVRLANGMLEGAALLLAFVLLVLGLALLGHRDKT